MKENIKIYIVLILIFGILVGGFFIWQNHQRIIEKKYQACLEKCYVKYSVSGLSRFLPEKLPSDCKICIANCNEKYGK